MNRLTLAFMLTAMICCVGLAQDEPAKRDGDGGKDAAAEKRAQAAQRRRYDNRRGRDVKDPAEFGKDQKQNLFSGPQAGEKLPPLPVTGAAGEFDGKEIDVVKQAGDKPHVLLLMAPDGVGIRGLFGLGNVTAAIEAKSGKDIHVCAVLLDDDPVELATFAKRFAGALSANIELLAISNDGRDGPGTYGLNRNISQTIIVAKKRATCCIISSFPRECSTPTRTCWAESRPRSARIERK